MNIEQKLDSQTNRCRVVFFGFFLHFAQAFGEENLGNKRVTMHTLDQIRQK